MQSAPDEMSELHFFMNEALVGETWYLKLGVQHSI